MTVGTPGTSGSTRIKVTSTGTSSNIMYEGYTAQVIANLAITETKTIGIIGNQSTVETTTVRTAQRSINSQTLPDPPAID